MGILNFGRLFKKKKADGTALPDEMVLSEEKEAVKVAAQEEKEVVNVAAQEEKEAVKVAAQEEKEAVKVAAQEEKETVKVAAQEEKEDISQKIIDLENRYEALKSEKQKQISELESQLRDAIDGSLDDVTKKKIDDLSNIQRKTKDLEEEIKDLEDEVDSYKKKLKEKESLIARTQDELDLANRGAQKIREELGQASEELKEKSKELDIKKQSIDFVQEILTAKQGEKDEDKRRGQRVDDLIEFIRGDFHDATAGLYEFSQNESEDPIFGNSLDSWGATAKKSWLNGKTTIAFVGEFSAGKTSIVNRILSQDDPQVPLLPVSSKATTAIPTYISGGDAKSYRFVSPNDEIKALKEDTFRKVNKEVLDQVKGVSSLIKYFVMRYKNPNLQNLSILDTPGFGSNDKDDSMRTIEVINECDALFWVFDVNAGTVNRSSISLIKDNLHRPLFIVINKIDSKSAKEVDQVEDLIRKTFEKEGIKPEGYIRFSKKAPLDIIMEPILSVHHDDKRDNYLNSLSDMAKQLCKQLLKKVKEAEKSATKLEAKNNKLIDNYNQILGELQDNCEEAANIPQWKSGSPLGILKQDRYEMAPKEGERMRELLRVICEEQSPKLVELCESLLETSSDRKAAWEDFSEAKTNYTQLQTTVEQLNKKIKVLKTIK